ncbi:DUF2336 domain-containing protein [Kordiimonas lipolytica]|uniref:DUF2336 domain-containing protein n=1 Tax=Kordiimonas lipolytica TaxID=1662421 RepID=A0ABV8UDB9_9PROT|nr:DUF2336 domain-containing protein [Kordiimonas lipolytica]
MLGKLKALLGGKSDKDKALPETLTKEDEQRILETGSEGQKQALANRTDARPEVLYFLAEDASPEIRRAIAQNPSTPIQAAEKLTSDEDEEVRSELARKIGRLIPGLKPGEQTALREKAIKVLEALAADQLPKVRAYVAEEIKSADSVPKAIVDRLARDVEEIVCGPILQYSPLLNDDDLREIIAAGVSGGALKSIASRALVSEEISQDIAATLDVPAISTLLTNPNAQIREDTLDQIIDHAKTVEDLHAPVALRPQLSIRAMKRIAGFVASALVHAMMEQAELPEEQAEELLERVRDRLHSERVGDEEEDKLAKQAMEYFEKGALDDKFVHDQIEENRRELLMQCLAVMADIPAKTVRQIVNSKSGRAVTALAWKAKLSMRTAYELQTKFALVPKAQLLNAKDGKDYPIDDNELEWHLSYFVEQAD